MSGILILGGGGHGKVIADILQRCGLPVRGYLEDDPTTWGTFRLGLPVLGPIESFMDYQPDGLVMGIGGNAARYAVVERLGEEAEQLWCQAIHPDTTIADSARIGRGVVIVARGVVNPDTIVGDHTIINTGATVGHDCHIGDFVHIAPGCNLTGGTIVGEGAFLGAGTVVIPCKTIGSWSTSGAGSVIVRDVPPHVMVKGVPARQYHKQENLKIGEQSREKSKL